MCYRFAVVGVVALKSRLRAVEPRWILLAGWLVAIAYAYPGYLNWDAGDQIYAARSGRFDDWHPPLMAAYWRVIETLIRGPLGMLLLQTSLFLWGLYAALCLRFSRRLAAVLAASLFLFPPLLTPMAAVWKDAQMAGFLLAGTMLALRGSWWARGVGLVLLALAAGVRDNGAAALPPLCVLIVASWKLVRSRIAVLALSVGVFVALTTAAMIANSQLTKTRLYPWYKTVAIHDLAGTICREDPMTDAEVRELLAGIELLQRSDLQARFCNAYETRVWFKLTFGGDENNMFSQLPAKPERLARKRAWVRAVREHTEAYLSHRAALMLELLGLSDAPIWEPVCQTITAIPDHAKRVDHNASLSKVQRLLGKLFEKLGKTMLYRPWVYLLLGLIALVYVARRRDGLSSMLLASGFLYEASYFIGAAAPDYRYSHWMITCVCIVTLTIFLERLRDHSAPPS